ncbi:hypothetical protein PENSTE_c017G01408 [Penicillium steckii]|uniref:DNA polymerase eta n=1 Tax=Penicillium steckii TaxID=303698 RepID=A0A1V6SXI1_9EURO|nr:hypothetical protein PENSTE_c017G01408 [Penicillium steckii]
MEQNRDLTSRFTRYDLALLVQSSVKSPLRVIALLDYDSFYTQCESVRLGISPDLPLCVQQWDAVIAVNYPARRHGVVRAMSVDEVRSKCPDIILQHVPTWREGSDTWAYRSVPTIMPGTDKAALDPYRLESRRGLQLIKRTLPRSPPQLVEKASVDEIYLDLSAQVYDIMLRRYPVLMDVESMTENDFLPSPRTYISNWNADSVFGTETELNNPDWDDISLHIGSEIVRDLRRKLYDEMKYTCSAGIAHNKLLAKLASTYRKPNHQTIILRRGTHEFLTTTKFTKLHGLGGDLGVQVVEKFQTNLISELLQVPLTEMTKAMGTTIGEWIFDIIRGEEHSKVNPRTHVQSMLSAKTFVPKIVSIDQASKWLRIFVKDLLGRLEELRSENYQVCPTIITLNHLIEGRFGPSRSKQITIPRSTLITERSLFNIAHDLLNQIVAEEKSWPCRSLSLRISGFQKVSQPGSLISSYFTPKSNPPDRSSNGFIDDRHQFHAAGEPPAYQRDVHLSSSENQALPSEKPSEYTFSEEGPLHTLESESEPYSCPHCKMSIHATEVLEHLDWHVALDLSKAN